MFYFHCCDSIMSMQRNLMRRDPLQRDLRKFLTIDIFVQSRLRSVKCLADRELPPGRKGTGSQGISGILSRKIRPGKNSLRFRCRIPLLRLKRTKRLRCSNGENCKGGVFMFKNKTDVFAPLRNVRVMTSAALLSAIAIILGFFKIPVTQLIEIRFAMLPIAVSGCLFGPVVGGAVGMVADIGGYLVKPTGPFFPGFTITSMMSGVIFGCMLYRQKTGPLRILMSQIVYTIICGVLLNSLWLSMLYGNGFIPVLTARFVKEIIMIPINTLMLVTIMEPVRKFRRAGAEIGQNE